MLHTIDATGMLSWHCPNPDCPYHNCAEWDREVSCLHHGPGQRTQEPGQSITAHISHPDVQWTGPNEIQLPPCPGCLERGVQSITTLRVHSEEELTPPIVTKNEHTGEILQVAPHPHPQFSGNLWIVDADTVRKRMPHPTLAHLSADQIAQMQTDIKSKAPDAPTDWMMSETVHHEIHAVYQHPAVSRHQQLAALLAETDKTYQPEPEQPTKETPEQMIAEVKAMVQELAELGISAFADPNKDGTVRTTVKMPDEAAFTFIDGDTSWQKDHLEEIITKVLQDRGVITSPRLPAADQPT